MKIHALLRIGLATVFFGAPSHAQHAPPPEPWDPPVVSPEPASAAPVIETPTAPAAPAPEPKPTKAPVESVPSEPEIEQLLSDDPHPDYVPPPGYGLGTRLQERPRADIPENAADSESAESFEPEEAESEEVVAERHDGFYLRMTAGGGTGRILHRLQITTSAKTEAHSGEYIGTYVGMNLMAGVTVGSGLVLGALVSQFRMSDADKKDTDQTIEHPDGAEYGNISFGQLAFMADWFPTEDGGTHLGGLFGIGATGMQRTDGEEIYGMTFGLFGGYDFWVSDQWSVGPMLEMTGTSVDEGDDSLVDARMLTVSLSGLYH